MRAPPASSAGPGRHRPGPPRGRDPHRCPEPRGNRAMTRRRAQPWEPRHRDQASRAPTAAQPNPGTSSGGRSVPAENVPGGPRAQGSTGARATKHGVDGFENLEALRTVDEGAAVLRVTAQFVDSHASAGDLPSVSDVKAVRIRRSVVRHVIDGSPVLGQPKAPGSRRSRRLVALRAGDPSEREVERRPVRRTCASCFVHICWEPTVVGVMHRAAREADLWCGCHCSRPRCVRRPRTS